MSQDKPDPLLDKMDALIKKHRGPPEAVATSGPPDGWLPVLTEVVKRGTPPAAVSTTLAVDSPAASPAIPAAHGIPAPDPNPGAAPTVVPHPEQLADQLLQELGPKLSAVMEQQVASELRKNLDETVATLLSQLDVSVRDMVRDAVAEKLKTPKSDS